MIHSISLSGTAYSTENTFSTGLSGLSSKYAILPYGDDCSFNISGVTGELTVMTSGNANTYDFDGEQLISVDTVSFKKGCDNSVIIQIANMDDYVIGEDVNNYMDSISYIVQYGPKIDISYDHSYLNPSEILVSGTYPSSVSLTYNRDFVDYPLSYTGDASNEEDDTYLTITTGHKMSGYFGEVTISDDTYAFKNCYDDRFVLEEGLTQTYINGAEVSVKLTNGVGMRISGTMDSLERSLTLTGVASGNEYDISLYTNQKIFEKTTGEYFSTVKVRFG